MNQEGENGGSSREIVLQDWFTITARRGPAQAESSPKTDDVAPTCRTAQQTTSGHHSDHQRVTSRRLRHQVVSPWQIDYAVCNKFAVRVLQLKKSVEALASCRRNTARSEPYNHNGPCERLAAMLTKVSADRLLDRPLSLPPRPSPPPR